eukprot:Clim_evm73s215 gene=Clim_evmTU73s215
MYEGPEKSVLELIDPVRIGEKRKRSESDSEDWRHPKLPRWTGELPSAQAIQQATKQIREANQKDHRDYFVRELSALSIRAMRAAKELHDWVRALHRDKVYNSEDGTSVILTMVDLATPIAPFANAQGHFGFGPQATKGATKGGKKGGNKREQVAKKLTMDHWAMLRAGLKMPTCEEMGLLKAEAEIRRTEPEPFESTILFEKISMTSFELCEKAEALIASVEAHTGGGGSIKKAQNQTKEETTDSKTKGDREDHHQGTQDVHTQFRSWFIDYLDTNASNEMEELRQRVQDDPSRIPVVQSALRALADSLGEEEKVAWMNTSTN